MSGAVPSPAARPPERAARVPRTVCPGCGRCGRVDPAPAPQRAPLRAGVARCWGGGRASPGGGAFHRCEGRMVSGAVPPPAARPPERAARVPRPVCPGCGRCGRVDPAPAPQRAPLRAGVARCGSGRRASPGGVPSTVVRGPWCQALSLPRPLVLRSVQPGFRDPCVPGAVDAGVWTQHRPHSVRLCGPALLAVGVAEGRPRGGLPSTVVRGAWCQALPLPRPSVLRSVQPGFRDPCIPGAVGVGSGTQHRPHSVRPCGPALLAVGVAEGRPRGGCLPPWRGALGVRRCPSPVCSPTAGWVAGVRWVCAVCVVSVLCVSWCVVLLFPWSSGAPLSGVSVRCCARRVPALFPPLCAPLARSLATPCSFRGFVALYPFLYPSPWYALFPCLRFVVCLCLFPCRPGLPPLNLRRERRERKRACGGGGFVATRHLELAGTSCDMRVRPACA